MTRGHTANRPSALPLETPSEWLAGPDSRVENVRPAYLPARRMEDLPPDLLAVELARQDRILNRLLIGLLAVIVAVIWLGGLSWWWLAVAGGVLLVVAVKET